MRQNHKLEKEAIIKNMNNHYNENFSKTSKGYKTPIRNDKPNIQLFNYNAYGSTIGTSKPTLQSNILYNITKKEKENYNDNQYKANTEVIEEAKVRYITNYSF